MSLQATRSQWSQLPNDLMGHVCGYLRGSPDGDRAIVATADVCREWQSNPILREERVSAAPRIEAQYPQELVQAFQHYRTRLGLLPVLDLGDRQGTRDYVDYLSPEQMTQPVMRFDERCETDGTRPGVAFKIHSRKLDKDYTLAIFQRSIGNPDYWALGWENSNWTIPSLYRKRHAAAVHDGVPLFFEGCQGCLVFYGVGNGYTLQISELFLPNFLSGRDPDFSLQFPGVQRTPVL